MVRKKICKILSLPKSNIPQETTVVSGNKAGKKWTNNMKWTGTIYANPTQKLANLITFHCWEATQTMGFVLGLQWFLDTNLSVFVTQKGSVCVVFALIDPKREWVTVLVIGFTVPLTVYIPQKRLKTYNMISKKGE